MYIVAIQTIFLQKIKSNHTIDSNFVSMGLKPLEANKTANNNLMVFTSTIRGVLSIIQCDKYLLSTLSNS